MLTINSQNKITFFIFLAASLFLSIFILYSGLNGPFLLDDQANLFRLEAINNNPNYAIYDFFKQQIAEGKFKRLLSLLTFTWQHQSWPDNPFDFKLVNLFLHYANALLVALLSFQLLRSYAGNQITAKQIKWFVGIIAFIWLIHPIQHSTVFYTIQRMTLLSSFFMLLGMNTYLYLRAHLNLNYFKDFIILLIGMGVILILAIASKDNGLLLCVYILLLETTIQKNPQAKEKFLSLFYFLFVFIPILFFSAYIYYKWDFLSSLGEIRNFTILERVMTELRILWSYLYYIIFPDIFNGGLFHDNIQISRGLLSPPSTLLSLSGFFLLFLISWLLRTKHSVFLFGLIWFVISHSMESTFIPLELYFEHRNYLAVLGIIWIFIYLFYKLWKIFPKIALFAAVIYFAVILLLSYQNAKIWSSELNLVANWAMPKKQSLRSYFFISNYWDKQKRLDKVIETYDIARQNMPDSLLIRINQYKYRCNAKKDSEKLIADLIHDIPNLKSFITINTTIPSLLLLYEKKQCNTLNYDNFMQLLVQLINHPEHSDPKLLTDFYYTAAKVEELSQNFNQAFLLMEKSYNYYPKVNVALIQAQWLVSAGQYSKSLIYINRAENLATSTGQKLENTSIPRIKETILRQIEESSIIEKEKE